MQETANTPLSEPLHNHLTGEFRPTPSPRGLRYVFFGTDGLRAGWSFLLFSFIFGALVYAWGSVLHAWRPPFLRAQRPYLGTMPQLILLVTHGVPFFCALFTAAMMARIEHRRMAQYFLGSPVRRLSQFLAGGLTGTLVFALLISILKWRGLLVFDGLILHGAAAVQWGAIWLMTFLTVAFFEEYLTRGYLQFTLSRGLAGIGEALGLEERSRRVVGFLLAGLFFSFVFGVGHKGNPGESPVGIFAAGAVGLVLAFSLWRTGSLWWAIGFHGLWDWSESFLFGTKDSGNAIAYALAAAHPEGPALQSGGLTGPEGSIFVLPILALTAVIIFFTLPSQRGAPSDPNYGPNEAPAA